MEWARLGGPIGEYLAEKGADRVMRRCIMAVGLIFLGIFLKIAGWRGRRDCGFGANPLWLRQLGRGLLIGVATLGGMSLAAWLLDFRIITPPADWAVMPAKQFLSCFPELPSACWRKSSAAGFCSASAPASGGPGRRQ